jgi:hypothetical protein
VAVRIERKKIGMTAIRRDQVKPGQVFQLVKKDGSLGDKAYVDVGNNGKHLSVNADSGELSSTADGAKQVAVVGKTAFKITRSSDVEATTRGAVKVGQVFRVKGKETLYAHLGVLSDGRLCSLNTSDPFNEDYAVTGNTKSNVEVVGEWAIEGSRV